ncbi:hypothetical protein FRB94_014408 [Tulasnella sp. JGI-2019a]|nr:hypothetical protein FRB94_014408 [Tulasnella sp. JGI-2019a]KAG9008606.1 hypothetical protein FRB93_006525 [Tulasnella sp. JGI-2019a]KAG9038473.1 hypothetical protein FRB95_001330 [Tulasnella sp. JGI-2019a]
MSAPSARMTAFLQSLPVDAFSFGGQLGAGDRVIYSHAPPGTPPTSPAGFGLVCCRAGWLDQSWDHATVSFYLPAKGSSRAERYSVCVKMSTWGQQPPATWRDMVFSGALVGVTNFL